MGEKCYDFQSHLPECYDFKSHLPECYMFYSYIPDDNVPEDPEDPNIDPGEKPLPPLPPVIELPEDVDEVYQIYTYPPFEYYILYSHNGNLRIGRLAWIDASGDDPQMILVMSIPADGLSKYSTLLHPMRKDEGILSMIAFTKGGYYKKLDTVAFSLDDLGPSESHSYNYPRFVENDKFTYGYSVLVPGCFQQATVEVYSAMNIKSTYYIGTRAQLGASCHGATQAATLASFDGGVYVAKDMMDTYIEPLLVMCTEAPGYSYGQHRTISSPTYIVDRDWEYVDGFIYGKTGSNRITIMYLDELIEKLKNLTVDGCRTGWYVIQESDVKHIETENEIASWTTDGDYIYYIAQDNKFKLYSNEVQDWE